MRPDRRLGRLECCPSRSRFGSLLSAISPLRSSAPRWRGSSSRSERGTCGAKCDQRREPGFRVNRAASRNRGAAGVDQTIEPRRHQRTGALEPFAGEGRCTRTTTRYHFRTQSVGRRPSPAARASRAGWPTERPTYLRPQRRRAEVGRTVRSLGPMDRRSRDVRVGVGLGYDMEPVRPLVSSRVSEAPHLRRRTG